MILARFYIVDIEKFTYGECALSTFFAKS